MTNEENLRALLAEAHSFVDPTEGDLFDRIHAALAEPVARLNPYNLAVAEMRGDAWQKQAMQRERERDEARAEVERLRGTWKWDAIKAYKRGAEAMREEAARLVDEMLSHTLTDAADRIRDLTIPEDEP